MTQIWINNKLCDLYADTQIRYTFQANDIAEVKDRQASYTNSFLLPKTAHNIRVFEGLGLSSDSSRFPYQKPSCQVKPFGFDLILNGWARVSETAADYKIYIYSGIIEFFKSIENKTLGNDLDLSEINHVKNLDSVVSSFTNPYFKYLITDFNGKTHYGDENLIINIDYLVPSVKVAYLWKKLHDKAGFTFSGETFLTDEFTSLYITYPKSISVNTLDLMVKGSGNQYVDFINVSGSDAHYYQLIMQNFTNYRSFTAPVAAIYKITIEVKNTFAESPVMPVKDDVPIRYYLGINEGTIAYSQRVNSLVMGELKPSENTSVLAKNVLLNAGDEIEFYNHFPVNGLLLWTSEYTVQVEKYDDADVSFTEELSAFAMTDFVKEILNTFALTPFPDEFSKHIKYLTLAERLNEGQAVDWTDKYVERVNETYVYDTYAQQNIFSYQYNERESSYHNGSLNIDNVNLTEKKDVWKSRLYSPEKELTDFYLGSFGTKYLRKFKFYDQEIKNSEIKYKGLDKRFHFAREQTIVTNATLGSETFGNTASVSTLPVASFSRLDWTSLLRKNYSTLGRILNDSRLHDIELNLSLTDIIHLDMSKLYFFAQEQQYYLLNKLNYDENTQKAEFIRVKRYYDQAIIVDPEDPTEYIIRIVWSDLTNTPKAAAAELVTMQISALSYPTDDELIEFEWEKFTGSVWMGLGVGTNPFEATTVVGVQKFRLKAIAESGDIYYSNELQYERIAITCRNYRATAVGSSGDDLTASFINCNGEQDSLTTYTTGFNSSMELVFCANEGTVTLNRGNLEDLGPCDG